MVKVFCPCGREYQVPEAQLGSQVKCAACSRTFVAQAAGSEPEVVSAADLLSPVEGGDDLDVVPSVAPAPEPEELKKPRLGDLAVERALVSKEHIEMCAKVQAALRKAGESEKRIGEILVEKGLIKPEQLEELLSEQYGEDSEEAPKPIPPPPRAEAPSKPSKPPEAEAPKASPASHGLRLLVLLCIAIAVFAAWRLWPAPTPQRTLAAYLQSCSERSAVPKKELAIRHLGITVREFRIDELLEPVHHDYTAELKLFASRKDQGGWKEMLKSVEMPIGKRQALRLVAASIPEAITPQDAGTLQICIYPVHCAMLFRPKGARLFKERKCRFLVVRSKTAKWSSGWKVAAYVPTEYPTPE